MEDVKLRTHDSHETRVGDRASATFASIGPVALKLALRYAF